MKRLGIDIETYSSFDLTQCGVYRYAEAPDFMILLFGYSVDGGPVRCVDLASGEELPPEIREALTDPQVIKTAYNATFERVCLSRHLGLPTGTYLDPAQWRCTMIQAARMGLPMGLAQCAEALHLTEGKMTEGRALIRYFSTPNKEGRRRLPWSAPEKWTTYKLYNIRDVEVEQAIYDKTVRLEVPEAEHELYAIDQAINDRGVMIDRDLVDKAAALDDEYKAMVLEQLRELTGVENPNSVAQFKDFLHRETGMRVESLNKKSADDNKRMFAPWPRIIQAFELRAELAKTSNKKYGAMQQCVCADGRIRGLLQFYGAARTGRWAGRLVQVQNLPQNHMPNIGEARRVVKRGDLDDLDLYCDNVAQTLSELIRTAFIARPGHTLHVCDFSAIEARVIAWLAGESWVLDVFRGGGDIYCATASQMFKVPVEKHGANSELRQKGKIAVLALGYGGGVGALEAMGGSRLGLTESEEADIVKRWRAANPRIVKLWSTIEQGCMQAIKTKGEVLMPRGLSARYRWGVLMITLPSGRTICYPRAAIGFEAAERWDDCKENIEYEGVNQTTKKWCKLRTYGGKLTENIVQATARDILAAVLRRCHRKGIDVVFHVHDEIVAEVPEGADLDRITDLFSKPEPWCRDLPLKGAGYVTPYYLKD